MSWKYWRYFCYIFSVEVTHAKQYVQFYVAAQIDLSITFSIVFNNHL